MADVIPKDWMDESDIFSKVYRDGVRYFISFAVRYGYLKSICACPCNKCRNTKNLEIEKVRQHLLEKGIDKRYRMWAFHGEKSTNRSTVHSVQEENIRPNMDEGVPEIRRLVDVAFGVHEMADGDISSDEAGQLESLVAEPDLGKQYEKYKVLEEEKLYPNHQGNHTTLSAVVELHNIKKMYGISGNAMSSILSTVKQWLPEGNTLPEKYPTMKTMLTDLGMTVKSIHACENHCILYYKNYEKERSCHVCGVKRYKVIEGKSGEIIETNEPVKVLKYFPIGERLKILYTIPWIAKEMTWHHRAEVYSTHMRHPIDSPQWKLIKDKFPDFAAEGRNVWLGIAMDGFNPFSFQTTSHSCWPVILVPYNLPPSLCMKSEFQMMSLLIPGPRAPGQDIDVFLQPLVDELKQLWDDGVTAFDMHHKESFQLKATLFVGIHDLPAYGILSSCKYHGYFGCPVCADDTESIRLSHSSKNVYTNYRRFLTNMHPFRKGKYLDLNTEELSAAPDRFSGRQILQKLRHVNYVPGKCSGKRKRAFAAEANTEIEVNDPIDESSNGSVDVTNAFSKKSILWCFDYWVELYVRHCVDVMHTEKNVMEHILDTILDVKNKSKDTVGAREDLRELNIRSDQWISKDPKTGKDVIPVAVYVLSKDEKLRFYQILKNLKVPTGFSSNLSNNVSVNPPRLSNLKSHDYHDIMEYLLPVLLQHAFPHHEDLRRALQQISLFFRILCAKVLVKDHLQREKYMVVEAMCVLEKYFPPAFFDISIHLMVHLADEALYCGPVRFRWMYPFERAMKDCKNLPSNKRYIAGSIAEAYRVTESARYAMEDMPNRRDGNHQATWEAFLGEDSEYSDEGPMKEDCKVVKLTPAQFVQIRRWILFRHDIEGVADYYAHYCDHVLPDDMDEVERQTKFIDWLYDKLLEEKKTDSEVWRYVKGPTGAKEYSSYRVNGFVFSPFSQESSRVTQDSGVCMDAVTTYRRKKGDKSHVVQMTKWYGIIKQILEVDYTNREIVEFVFYCDWVKVESGCKICPDSNLVVVNLDRIRSVDRYFDEPVILACEASKCSTLRI